MKLLIFLFLISFFDIYPDNNRYGLPKILPVEYTSSKYILSKEVYALSSYDDLIYILGNKKTNKDRNILLVYRIDDSIDVDQPTYNIEFENRINPRSIKGINEINENMLLLTMEKSVMLVQINSKHNRLLKKAETPQLTSKIKRIFLRNEIVSVATDTSVYIYDLEESELKLRSCFHDLASPINRIIITPDEKYLIYNDSNCVIIRSLINNSVAITADLMNAGIIDIIYYPDNPKKDKIELATKYNIPDIFPKLKDVPFSFSSEVIADSLKEIFYSDDGNIKFYHTDKSIYNSNENASKNLKISNIVFSKNSQNYCYYNELSKGIYIFVPEKIENMYQ